MRRGYDISPGYPGNGLSDAEHDRRFDDCMAAAGLPLPDDAVQRLRELAVGVERMDDITSCLDLLRSPIAA